MILEFGSFSMKDKTWTLVSELDGGPVTYTLLYKGLLNGVSLKYTAYDYDRGDKPFASGHYQTFELIVKNGLDIAIKDEAEIKARNEILDTLRKLKGNIAPSPDQ